MTDLGRVVEASRTVVNRLRHPERHVECWHCGANLDSVHQNCPTCDRSIPTIYEID